MASNIVLRIVSTALLISMVAGEKYCNTTLACPSEFQYCDTSAQECKCIETYIPSNDTQYCKQISCHSNQSCNSPNQICIKGLCECKTDFFMNDTIGKCVPRVKCDNVSDCRSFSRWSYCSKHDGLCRCGSIFIERESFDYEGQCDPFYCEVNSDCTQANAVCMRYCHCKSNYRTSDETGLCEKFICKSNKECNDRDHGMECKGGQCVCYEGLFTRNETTTYCENKKCHSDKDCSGSHGNSVCMNNKCVCATNFKFNEETLKCEPYKCEINQSIAWDCYPWNFNSISGSDIIWECSSGQCVCKKGYVRDENNGGYCTETSTTYGKSCDSSNNLNNGNCDYMESCVNNTCHCAPQYKYHKNINNCLKFVCKSSEECQSYDMNRVCSSGKCICPKNYQEDWLNGHVCVKMDNTLKKNCSHESECSGTNQRCVDKICECDAGYKFEDSAQSCVSFNCTQRDYDDCGSNNHDYYRKCIESKCVCQDGYEPDPVNGNKCTEIDSSGIKIKLPDIAILIFALTLIMI